MITRIANKATQAIYDGINSKNARTIPEFLHDKVRRLMDQLDNAETLDDMKIPPVNRLEQLSGDLSEYYSVCIDQQWQVIFKWDDTKKNTSDVYIDDQHNFN